MKGSKVYIFALFAFVANLYLFQNFDRFYNASLESVAEVATVSGSVNIRSPYDLFDARAESNDKIADRSVIRTDANATALIRFNDGSQVTVLPNSTVELNVPSGGRPQINIQSGLVATKSKSVEVKDASSAATLKSPRETKEGTVYGVSSDESSSLLGAANTRKNDGSDNLNEQQSQLALLKLLQEDVSKKFSGIDPRRFRNQVEQAAEASEKENELDPTLKDPEALGDRLLAAPDLPDIEVQEIDLAPKENPLEAQPKGLVQLADNEDISPKFLPFPENKSKIMKSHIRGGANIWVRSMFELHPIKVKVSDMENARVFYFVNRDQDERNYLRKGKDWFQTKVALTDISTDRTVRVDDIEFKEVRIPLWVSHRKNKKKIKRLGVLKYYVAGVSELNNKRAVISYVAGKEDHTDEFLYNSPNRGGAVRKVHLRSSTLISDLWRGIKAIKSVKVGAKIPWESGTGIVGIRGDQPTFLFNSKNKRHAKRILELTQSNFAVIGKASDYLGYLGGYDKVVSFIDKYAETLSDGEKIFFAINERVVPIDIDLLIKDKSVFNLINENYQAAFKTDRVIINGYAIQKR